MTETAATDALKAALALHQRGDLAAAEAAYRAILERHGPSAPAEHMLGLALHQSGRSREALTWLERAAREPGPTLWINQASVLLALGRAAEAEALSRRAGAAQPGSTGAGLNLGLALAAQGRHREAVDALRVVLVRHAGHAPARRALARSLLALGDPDAALDALGPLADDEAALIAAEALIGKGRSAEARECLSTLTSRPKIAAAAHVLLARLAHDARDSDAALTHLDQVLTAGPDHRAALMQQVSLRLERGEADAALAPLAAWIATHPEDAEAQAFYLRRLQYASEPGPDDLLAAHRAWAVRHAPPAQRVVPDDADPERALRIGWVSPSFRASPVSTFFHAVLAELVALPGAMHVLYHLGPADAPGCAEFRAIAPAWRQVEELDAAALCARVRADRIDVLVDLAGHASGNRLAAFAARAAPVQVTWLDSFGTTGIPAIDFLLADAWLVPPGDEAHYSERILRLARGRLCYAPPLANAASPWTHATRYVSFNNFAKLNDGVVAAWAAILRATPDWTLHLKGRGGDDAGVIRALGARFARHGVPAGRLVFSGHAPLADVIGAYREAAIALDPFPFSGAATTCDALWMGLPVVTLPGATLVSRQSAALLSALGRPEWIARDADDYVRIATALAADTDTRRTWRAIAAGQVLERLGDAPGFARDLLAALRKAWRRRAAEDFRASR